MDRDSFDLCQICSQDLVFHWVDKEMWKQKRIEFLQGEAPRPSSATTGTSVRFLGNIKCNALTVSWDPKGFEWGY